MLPSARKATHHASTCRTFSINPFWVSLELPLELNFPPGLCWQNNFRGRHHFRFPVPLQADCCYFYGMADRRFLTKKPFLEQGHDRGTEMKHARTPAYLKMNGFLRLRASASIRAVSVYWLAWRYLPVSKIHMWLRRRPEWMSQRPRRRTLRATSTRQEIPPP